MPMASMRVFLAKSTEIEIEIGRIKKQPRMAWSFLLLNRPKLSLKVQTLGAKYGGSRSAERSWETSGSPSLLSSIFPSVICSGLASCFGPAWESAFFVFVSFELAEVPFLHLRASGRFR